MSSWLMATRRSGVVGAPDEVRFYTVDTSNGGERVIGTVSSRDARSILKFLGDPVGPKDLVLGEGPRPEVGTNQQYRAQENNVWCEVERPNSCQTLATVRPYGAHTCCTNGRVFDERGRRIRYEEA